MSEAQPRFVLFRRVNSEFPRDLTRILRLEVVFREVKPLIACPQFHKVDTYIPRSSKLHNTGNSELQRDIVVMIEHVLSDPSGEWRVSIFGSQANDQWEMKIFGPNAFERSYVLEGAAGQHEPRAIASIVSKMVPVLRFGESHGF